MAKVSIIIVNWNTKSLIQECLCSLNSNEKGDNFEIIVVDNNSSDGSVESIRANFPDVRLIENKTNRGFAAACNQAISHSNGEYLLLLNSDTKVKCEVINKCVGFMQTVPDAGAVGCQILGEDYNIQPSCFNFINIYRILYKKCLPTKIKKIIPRTLRERLEIKITSWDYDRIRPCDYVMGSFLLLRRDALDDVGKLDERFFMYAEEADLCFRLWEDNWKVYYYPNMSISHKKEGSSKNVKFYTKLQRVASRSLFIEKHHSGIQYLSYIFLSLLYNLLLLSISKLYKKNSKLEKLYHEKLIVLLKSISPLSDIRGKAAIKGELVKDTEYDG